MRTARAVCLAVLAVILFASGCGGGITITGPVLTASTTPFTSTTSSTASSPSITTTTPTLPSTTATTSTTAITTTTASPSAALATVSGLVYFRDPARSFAVNAAPADLALNGATVSIEDETAVTGQEGAYEFDNVAAGFRTLWVNLDGYLPAQVSWRFEAGQDYVFNIGMYRAPETVNPHPGFVNGIITWDAGGWLIDYYYEHGLFPPTYTAAAEQAGGTLVTVSDPVFVTDSGLDRVVMATQYSPWWRMMNEDEYAALATDAHSRGLQFMVWLGVIDGGNPGYWDLVYAGNVLSESFWDDWFSEYETYAVQYATMAEKLGIEYVCLGHDMGYVTGTSRFPGDQAESLARWTKLVDAIRSVYHGQVVYFGGVDLVDGYYEDDGYPTGFVDLFDAMGLNVQSVVPAFNPSLDQLKRGLGDLLDRYTGWTRPVYIMVRTPSVDGGTSFEEFMEPLLEVNHAADAHIMNLWQQADMYEALYEAISARHGGNGQAGGVFSWGYNYLDDYLTVPGQGPNGTDAPMAMDKSGNVRGKPAEAVMKFWAEGW